MHEPDPTLVHRARDGDAAAFDEIVRLLRGPVLRYAEHLVRDHALAEDITQETFVRCHRNIARFESHGKFTTWIVSIAHNAGVDAMRARDRHARAWSRTPQPPPPSDPAVRAELRSALASLPARLRESLLLVEVTGLSYAEAAEVIGIPAGTVKSRVFNARKRLARWFAEGHDDAM